MKSNTIHYNASLSVGRDRRCRSLCGREDAYCTSSWANVQCKDCLETTGVTSKRVQK